MIILYHKKKKHLSIISFICFILLSGLASGGDRIRINLDSIMIHYINTSTNFIRSHNLEQAKIYLDSASNYEKTVREPLTLGFFYHAYGDYYISKLNEEKSHENYYKAIDFYEKAGEKGMKLLVYRNLSFSYIQKNDTESLKRIIDKMLPFALNQGNKTDVLNTYSVIRFYYNCLYEKNKNQLCYLDSVIFYDKQVISIFESEKDIKVNEEDIAYNYISLASSLLKKGNYDQDSITFYARKAEELANPLDTAMLVNCLWVEGEAAYHAGNFREAEEIFIRQLSLMDNWLVEKNLNIYLDLYDRLSRLSEIRKNYDDALSYERKKQICLDHIHDAEKYTVIRELETKYEVERKDLVISQLKETNRFRERINLLTVGILILFLLSFIFILRWSRSKKKAALSQLKITEMEKTEALLQSQLKDEQLKKAELEKYRILSDSYFKDEQIAGKEKELDEIRKKQVNLNLQISDLEKEFKEYKESILNKPEITLTDPYFSGIVRDIYGLISKRLDEHSNQKEYLEKLCEIPESFFLNLKKRSHNLSEKNIKYCICFAIGMENQHIAECLSVEAGTVYITKIRLRKDAFRLGEDVDLILFLRLLMS